MYIHIHILSDIVQRFKVKKIHVDLLFVPVDIKDHFSFQISQKMKLSNEPGKVESNLFCYAAMCFPAHKNVLIFTQRMHKPTERPFM